MQKLTDLRRFAPSMNARLRLALYLGAGAFAAFTLLRLALLTVLATPSTERSLSDILLALAGGALRDLGVALFFALFYLVILNFRSKPWRKKFGRGTIRTVIALGIFLLLFSAIAEMLFWDEFDSRLNGIALYYLIFPREVIGNLQQSFNIALYMPIVGAIALALTWALRRPIARALDAAPVKGARLSQLGAAVLAIAIVLPLARALPEDMSANREISQLAENGWDTFISAAFTNDQDYDGVYPNMNEADAIKTLRGLVAQSNTTFLDPDNIRSIRRWVDNGTAPKKLNIVIVTNESFGSKFVDVLDNHSGIKLTPALDKLSQQGLFFTNIYPSGDRTVRGLEATETAFTPIPGISTARRSESKDMYSLPYLLKSFGYQSAVLYGGHAIFDNMGTFWSGIGFNPVWDESFIRHDSFKTAWGVSDEDLYTEALQRMDEMAAEKKPFLLTMMTVSNHRPYRFPENHIKFDPKLTNRFNSARYADWAYGDFIERAKKHGWFDNTVFVFVADHSEKINGAAQVPLQDMRIPILIYSPKNIAPRVVPTLGAQIDLIPTLLGELGFSYVSPFFGKDITLLPSNGGWTSTAFNFSIAYSRPGHVVVLRPHQPSLGYAFTPGLKPLVSETPDPETLKEATALTQTAHHMFYSHQYHMPADGKWPQYTPPSSAVAHEQMLTPDKIQ
ncbi:MAG TPA: sulfatase-like hydrolase/transferase [Parvibaculum sp.]|jgi:phosphoglycerol transferase MdoB-like AlkP superfamily enzyme